MSGPFYGSLAASASVFVAILTALLVNNYVRIRADRRQLTHRLERLNEDIEGLKERRDKHKQTIEQIRSEWEQRRRNRAEENVDEFIEDYVSEEISKPIEKLSIDGLHEELAEFLNKDDIQDLEGNGDTPHHKEVLEERYDEIEDIVLQNVTRPFALNYKGQGGGLDVSDDQQEDIADDSDLPEALKDPEYGLGSLSGLTYEQFLDRYKNRHGLEHLNEKTKNQLKRDYDEIVDTSAISHGLNDLIGDQLASSAWSGLDVSPALGADFNPNPKLPPYFQQSSGVKSMEEKETVGERRKKLIELNSEIQTLERQKRLLGDQIQRVHPEVLESALFANVLTIFLSVVSPMIAFLLTATGVSFPLPGIPDNSDLLIVFILWLVGLIIVFEWIHAEINDKEPRIYKLYLRARGL